MATRKTWGAIIVAACCLLAGGTGTAWTRDTPAQGNGATHISVNDTVYGVLHNHRSLMSIKENRAVLEHELNKARAGFGPRVDVTGEIGVGVLSDTTSRGLNLDDQWLSVGSVSAKLVQPIWDGFATRSRVRAARPPWIPSRPGSSTRPRPFPWTASSPTSTCCAVSSWWSWPATTWPGMSPSWPRPVTAPAWGRIPRPM